MKLRIGRHYGVRTGIIENAPDGGIRTPSTLICPPAGVPNSILPLWFAVTGNWSDSTKALWPLPARLTMPKPIRAPVLSLIRTGVLVWADTALAIATPTARPFVLSNDKIY